MPSSDDLKQFERLQAGVAMDATLKLVPPPTPLPEEVRKRFPSMAAWEKAETERHQKLLNAIKGGVP